METIVTFSVDAEGYWLVLKLLLASMSLGTAWLYLMVWPFREC